MLITTKLTMPFLRQAMVDRKHLIDILETGKNRPLILICGHAGSGKTSLATQWLNLHKDGVAWYSLDDNDNEPDLFFRYLLTSLLGRSEKIDKAFSPFLQGQKTISGKEAMAKVVDELGMYEKDIFLVLDDFHVIDNEDILAGISYLIQYAPACLHLVLLSRSEPPFSLIRLRSQDHITQITALNLQFSQSEAEDFFITVLNMDLLPDQVQQIFKTTEGWVSGLQLAGMSLRKHPSSNWIKTLSLGHYALVREYLKDEVFKVQPENIQTFLLKTSILHRFNADLCRDITDMEDAGTILEELEQNHVFITSLDTAHDWYRYHPLFAESLKNHLINTQKEMLSDLHKRAALWNAKNSFFEEVFYHAHASQDMQFLSSLLEDHLMFYLLGCEFVSCRRWLDKVPKNIFENSLILQIHHQLLAVSQWDFDRAESLMQSLNKREQQLLEKYDDQKKKRARDLLIVARHSNSIFNDTEACDLDALHHDLNTISSEHKYIKMFLSDYIPWSYMEKGDVEKAVRPTLDNLAFYRENKIGFGVFNQIRSYATIEIIMGHMTRAQAKLEEEMKIAQKAGISNLPFRSDYYIMMGIISYYQNNIEKALEYTEAALVYLDQTRLNYIKFEAQLNLAFILHSMGRTTTSLHSMEKALVNAKSMGSSIFLNMAKGAMARLALFQDNPDLALEWSKARKLDMKEPFSENFEYDCLVQAHLLIEQGHYKEAVQLLEALRPRSLKRQRHEPVLRIDILLAAALDAAGERKKAIQILELALCFAVPENYIQHFIIFTPYIADMLMALGGAKDPMVKDHASTICRHCNLEQPADLPKGNIPISTTENITPREVDILKLIAYGYSNNEIADKLFISINTVKFYNKSIFAKLDAKNRVQAGIKARKLKMI